MDFKQIKYFVTIAECGNFREAAEKCYISQSAISQQLQSLESNLGYKLLIRENRKFELTPILDEQLVTTPTEELLNLEILQPENIENTLHAYQLAKRCNEKRVMYEAVRWEEKKQELTRFLWG